MIEDNKNFDDNSILAFFLQPQGDPAQAQVQFCHNLTAKLFEKRNSPCKQEFLEVRIKRRILDHYLKGTCHITSFYGISTIEILSPKSNHPTHQTQTHDIDIEFSKVNTDYIKNIQHLNSQ